MSPAAADDIEFMMHLAPSPGALLFICQGLGMPTEQRLNKVDKEQELGGRTLLFMLPNHQIGNIPQHTRQERTTARANKNHKNRNNTEDDAKTHTA